MMASAEQYLILLPNNLGDVITATPVPEVLHEQDSRAKVTFFVEEGFDGGLIGNPACDSIFRFPRKGIRDELVQEMPHGLSALRQQLAALSEKGEYARIVNLCQHPYLSYLVTLLSARQKLGRYFLREGNHAIEDSWSQYLYAIPFARSCNHLHVTDIYKRIAGGAESAAVPRVYLGQQEKAEAGQFLLRRGIAAGEKPLAVMQPGASVPAKRWPPDGFVALAKALIDRGWRIVISGAPAELELATAVAERIGPSAVLAAGETSFRQAVAITSHALACVTGDSALMHAAAALDVPTFALFGPTNPVETGPYGEGHYVFSSHCADRPCFCTTCRSQLCLKSILPETLLGCILEDRPPASSRCDVFRTRIRDGVFSLECLTSANNPFFSTESALLVRKAFEPSAQLSIPENEPLRIAVEQSRDFVIELQHLERMLRRLEVSPAADLVQLYEQRRKALSSRGGIQAFWTAVLNIRLNSIPVLDPLAAIRAGASVLRATARQIQSVLPE